MKKTRVVAATKASLIHFSASLAIALAAAYVVFYLWFPYPLRELAGGKHLFLIMVIVDILCGPLLTALIFNPLKSKRELIFDLSFIGLIQLMALFYGIYSISLARPIALVFEVDRFVVISAAQVDPHDLKNAPNQLQKLSWGGPILLSTRAAKDSNEFMQSLSMSMLGVEPSARPARWQEYERNKDQVLLVMKKLERIEKNLSSEQNKMIIKLIKQRNNYLNNIYYLPLVSQKSLSEWIVLLNNKADVIGYARADGFQ